MGNPQVSELVWFLARYVLQLGTTDSMVSREILDLFFVT